jgi:F0F1-type ATP synthase epsilon subunit
MLIKCKQIREGGTSILMDDTNYAFIPNGNGDHVAEVTDKDHIKAFLAIKEGFAKAKPSTDEADAEAIVQAATQSEADALEQVEAARVAAVAEAEAQAEAQSHADAEAQALIEAGSGS